MGVIVNKEAITNSEEQEKISTVQVITDPIEQAEALALTRDSIKSISKLLEYRKD